MKNPDQRPWNIWVNIIKPHRQDDGKGGVEVQPEQFARMQILWRPEFPSSRIAAGRIGTRQAGVASIVSSDITRRVIVGDIVEVEQTRFKIVAVFLQPRSRFTQWELMEISGDQHVGN